MTHSVTQPSLWQKAWHWFNARLVFRCHWILVLIAAVAIPALTRKTEKPGEFYPFSNYPMYSSFEPRTYLVYITDLQNQPLAISSVFKTSASDVKKMYDTRLNALKKRAPRGSLKASLPLPLRKEAADETLRELVKKVSPSPQLETVNGLRLHQVDINYDGYELSQQTTQVGEVTLP